MKIYLVRHGQTRFNTQDRMRGRLDEPLSEQGFLQARKTACYLKEKSIKHIFSSPLERAYNTALEIGSECQIQPEKKEAFNDLDFGKWQGMLRSEIRGKYSGEYSIYEDYPEEFFSSSGDNLWSLQRRAFAGLNDIVGDIDSDIAVVSHYVTLRMILLACLGADPRAYWRISLDNCSVSTVHYDNKRFIIEMLNETCHLI